MNYPLVADRAERDIRDIYEFISEYSLASAARTIRRLREGFLTLADNPYIGHERPDLGPNLRSLAVRPYVIIYQPLEQGVEIVRVTHGSRDINRLI